MNYDLAGMWLRQAKPRRRSVAFRPIPASAVMARDLYATSYHPVVALWSEASAGIVAEYERALSGITGDSPEGVGRAIEQQAGAAAAIILEIRARLDQWALRMEKWQRNRWRAAVRNATGVDVAAMIGPADARIALAAAIERNVSLVRSVSEQSRQRIGEIVFAGLNQRKPARAVAAEIRGAVAMTRRRALVIAGDQTSKLAATLNTERARQAGLEFYEWVHSGKLHPRVEHLMRDGKRYEYGHFGDDEPGMAINCGCTARGVLSLDGEF